MGGNHQSTFQLRLPDSLRERFKQSCSAGGAGRISGADALRGLMEMRIAFTEAKRRQPNSIAELCEWYLANHKGE